VSAALLAGVGKTGGGLAQFTLHVSGEWDGACSGEGLGEVARRGTKRGAGTTSIRLRTTAPMMEAG